MLIYEISLITVTTFPIQVVPFDVVTKFVALVVKIRENNNC